MKNVSVIIIMGVAALLLLSTCISRENMFELATASPGEGFFVLVDVYSTSNTSVRVVFSSNVGGASSQEVSHYSIPGLTIVSARIDSSVRTSVDITTFLQQDTQYLLAVSGVVDADGITLENNGNMNFQGDVAPSILSAGS